MGRTSSRVAPPVVQVTSLHTVALLALLAGSSGCERLVMLGSDCPNQRGCDEDDGPLGNTDELNDAGTAVNDAGQIAVIIDGSTVLQPNNSPNATPHDAGVVQGLGNMSFEITNDNFLTFLTDSVGLTSVDVYIGNVIGAVPFVGNVLFSRVAPWYACGTGTLAVKGAGETKPTEGEVFVWMPRNGLEGKSTGLYQNLDAGFEPGLSYSFQLDALARADEGATVQVRLGATNTPCANDLGSTYTLSPPLEKQASWRTLCLTFVPTEHLNTLYILPQIVGGTGSSVLSVDNLRTVDRCP